MKTLNPHIFETFPELHEIKYGYLRDFAIEIVDYAWAGEATAIHLQERLYDCVEEALEIVARLVTQQTKQDG